MPPKVPRKQRSFRQSPFLFEVCRASFCSLVPLITSATLEIFFLSGCHTCHGWEGDKAMYPLILCKAYKSSLPFYKCSRNASTYRVAI